MSLTPLLQPMRVQVQSASEVDMMSPLLTHCITSPASEAAQRVGDEPSPLPPAPASFAGDEVASEMASEAAVSESAREPSPLPPELLMVSPLPPEMHSEEEGAHEAEPQLRPSSPLLSPSRPSRSKRRITELFARLPDYATAARPRPQGRRRSMHESLEAVQRSARGRRGRHASSSAAASMPPLLPSSPSSSSAPTDTSSSGDSSCSDSECSECARVAEEQGQGQLHELREEGREEQDDAEQNEVVITGEKQVAPRKPPFGIQKFGRPRDMPLPRGRSHRDRSMPLSQQLTLQMRSPPSSRRSRARGFASSPQPRTSSSSSSTSARLCLRRVVDSASEGRESASASASASSPSASRGTIAVDEQALAEEQGREPPPTWMQDWIAHMDTGEQGQEPGEYTHAAGQQQQWQFPSQAAAGHGSFGSDAPVAGSAASSHAFPTVSALLSSGHNFSQQPHPLPRPSSNPYPFPPHFFQHPHSTSRFVAAPFLPQPSFAPSHSSWVAPARGGIPGPRFSIASGPTSHSWGPTMAVHESTSASQPVEYEGVLLQLEDSDDEQEEGSRQ